MLKSRESVINSILVLMAGAGLSQIVLVLASPVLTRLFTADDLGLFGFYITVISILVIFSTGRYEIATMLPKSNVIGHRVLGVAIRRTVIFFVCLLLVAGIVQESLVAFSIVKREWLVYILPFGVIILAFFNIKVQGAIRGLNYHPISRARMSHSFFVSSASILGGILFTPNVFILILSDLVARILSVTCFKKFTSFRIFLNNAQKLKETKQRYSEFSKFEQITAFLSISSLQLPIVVIPFIFTPAVAGYYFIVYRVVTAPVSLISNAALDVFKSSASKAYNETGSARRVFLTTIKWLFIIGLGPVLLLLFYGEVIFTTVFGEPWAQAGIYAQILAPSLLMRLVACPVGFILQLREKVRLNTAIYGLFFILTCASLVAGYLYDSPTIMVILISISTGVFYAVQLLFAFVYSENNEKKLGL